MKRFKWQRDPEINTRKYCRWLGGEICLDPLYGFHDKAEVYAEGSYARGVNGKNTAYATFTVKHRFFTNMTFGFTINKHFKHPRAWMKARAWLDYMLNNCPNYVQEFRYDNKS